MDKLAYTVKEAAKLLSLGQNTLYEMVQQKKMGHIKVRSKILIPHMAIEKWLAENMIEQKGGEVSETQIRPFFSARAK